jgi:hypothetical protein
MLSLERPARKALAKVCFRWRCRMRTAAAGSEDLGAQVSEAHGWQSSGRRAFDGRSELQSRALGAAGDDNGAGARGVNSRMRWV